MSLHYATDVSLTSLWRTRWRKSYLLGGSQSYSNLVDPAVDLDIYSGSSFLIWLMPIQASSQADQRSPDVSQRHHLIHAVLLARNYRFLLKILLISAHLIVYKFTYNIR